MAQLKQLRRALDVLTRGEAAAVAESLRAAAVDTQRAARPWVMAKGIQGLGIANAVTDGQRRDELALKVYVEKKLPRSQCENPVPKIVQVPGLDDELPTDVEAIGKVVHESNTERVRPAIPGYGVGHPDVTVGTFGCLVRKRGDGTSLYILSNSHVLANDGVAKKGDVILQPGVYDDGERPQDSIARLDDWVAFKFSETGYPNLVDAAIAKVNAAGSVKAAIRKIGVPRGVSNKVRRGMRVQKTGRTTDYTQGLILDVDYRMALTYKKPGGGKGRAGLRDLVLCTRYTDGGDSGAAVLDMQGRVVGLHFAGSPSSSIFMRIANVLEAFQLEIVTDDI